MLEGVTCFKDFLVLEGREQGYTKVRWEIAAFCFVVFPFSIIFVFFVVFNINNNNNNNNNNDDNF